MKKIIITRDIHDIEQEIEKLLLELGVLEDINGDGSYIRTNPNYAVVIEVIEN